MQPGAVVTIQIVYVATGAARNGRDTMHAAALARILPSRCHEGKPLGRGPPAAIEAQHDYIESLQASKKRLAACRAEQNGRGGAAGPCRESKIGVHGYRSVRQRGCRDLWRAPRLLSECSGRAPGATLAWCDSGPSHAAFICSAHKMCRATPRNAAGLSACFWRERWLAVFRPPCGFQAS